MFYFLPGCHRIGWLDVTYLPFQRGLMSITQLENMTGTDFLQARESFMTRRKWFHFFMLGIYVYMFLWAVGTSIYLDDIWAWYANMGFFVIAIGGFTLSYIGYKKAKYLHVLVLCALAPLGFFPVLFQFFYDKRDKAQVFLN